MFAHLSNENLLEELEGRQMAVMHAQRAGLSAQWANFHRREINAIERELARRRTVARNNRRRQARAREMLRKAVRRWVAGAYAPPTAGGAMYRRLASVRGKRNVGTSMSPNRRSPNRRSPKRRRSAGTSPRKRNS